MDIVSVFAVIAGIVFIGYFGELIFKKTKIPDVLILIAVGIVIGSVFNWANVDTFGDGAKLFTTFALVYILFQGALNINFLTLFRSLSGTLKLTTSSFILTVLVVTVISYPLYHDWLLALLVGIILGGTSSAVVIPLVTNLGVKEKYGLVLTLESAISDVFCIVGALSILEILQTGSVVASEIFRSVISSFSLALIIGLIAGVFWIFLLNKSTHLANSYMVTVAFVIGLYAFVESDFVQASGAIAALSFGLMLGNSKSILNLNATKTAQEKKNPNLPKEVLIKDVLSLSAKSFFSEISFFVKTFFFVYLGILIDFSNLWIMLYGALLTLGIYITRPFAVKLIFSKENLEPKDRSILEIMVPKGLAAAVLAGLAVQSGFLGSAAGDFVNLILSIVLFSIVLTSILTFMVEKGWFKGFLPFLYKHQTD